MSATLSWPDILLRLACTAIAGALIGLDRGEHAHPAGLRTTILIAVAAAMAMIQANWLVVHMADTHVSVVRLDMMRLPLGILSGVGFIGAGAILRRGEIVRGITTAATIWLTTVIGLCFGGGQIGLGAIATAIALATLWIMKYVEESIVVGRRGTIAVTFSTAGLEQAVLGHLLAAHGFKMRSHRVEVTRDGAMRYTCSGRYRGAYPDWSFALIRELAARSDVCRVEWRDSD
ncbi:MAG TPA: MgtC/SapB family protein [Acetobacteraceae bacterium]|jgi:putative Mg2+ transporter-C (MgtC) family protein